MLEGRARKDGFEEPMREWGKDSLGILTPDLNCTFSQEESKMLKDCFYSHAYKSQEAPLVVTDSCLQDKSSMPRAGGW